MALFGAFCAAFVTRAKLRDFGDDFAMGVSVVSRLIRGRARNAKGVLVETLAELSQFMTIWSSDDCTWGKKGRPNFRYVFHRRPNLVSSDSSVAMEEMR